MFNKIRRNFVIVAMASVTLIVLIVNVVMLTINFNQQVHSSDEIIKVIENDGPRNEEPQKPSDPKVGDSRYFIVHLNSDKTVFKIDLTHVDQTLITYEKATEYTNEIVSQNKERGYKDIYRYHYDLSKNKIVYLNCQRSIENFRNYSLITTISSAGALVAYFLIIFFGSKIVLKPVKESYEKQNRFITNASHELKTPLTIISANNELLEMKKGENEYSKSINKQIIRMNNMIKDLITLSKLNEGRKVVFENTPISEIVNNVTNDFEVLCEENKLKLRKEIDKEIAIVANKDYVKQMVSILLDNSIKYAKSYVYISLKKYKNTVIYKNSNDCKSIENGDLSKYKERFYRSDKSRITKEGSGIGLSLLDELVNQLHGKLKIYGENNVFNVEIIFPNKNKIK